MCRLGVREAAEPTLLHACIYNQASFQSCSSVVLSLAPSHPRPRPTSSPWSRTIPQTPAGEQQSHLHQGLRKPAVCFPCLPDSPQGLSPFRSLTPEGGSLSSRLEELRSESLSLSLETTGKNRHQHRRSLLPATWTTATWTSQHLDR